MCVAGVAVLGLYPSAWRQSVPGALFTALVGMAVLFVCTYVLAALIFPPTGEPAEDLVDDLAVLYAWAKAHALFARGLFRRMERLAEYSWAQALIRALDPRKHPWRVVALAAAGMELALLMAEVLGEGVPQLNLILVVAAVFITIEGAGVLLGYLLFRQYLGLFRRQPIH
jgi:O-antigen/teichoic acid export membrane protein